MNVKRCDRCGKIYGEYKGYRLFLEKDTAFRDLKGRIMDADLCPGCEELLVDWFKENPEYKE